VRFFLRRSAIRDTRLFTVCVAMAPPPLAIDLLHFGGHCRRDLLGGVVFVSCGPLFES
jgi:hypothetical protein